jgi:hypothetical protein
MICLNDNGGEERYDILLIDLALPQECDCQGRNYHWDNWGNSLTKNSVFFFLINDLQRCLVYPFVLILLKWYISRCSNRRIVSCLFRMLLYVGVHSASNRIHPSFSYIMSLRDVVIHIDDTSCTKMDIWMKVGSCRKRKAGQSELGLCKLYVVIFHTQISTSWQRVHRKNSIKA